MNFNSIDFLVFLPIVVVVHYALPHRWRWLWLLAASYVFYAWWRVAFVALLFASTCLHYAAARLIDGSADPVWRRRFLLGSIAADLGLLGYFKYAGFVTRTIGEIGAQFGLGADVPVLHVLLPTAISFYTLQSIGYTIDVYHRRLPAERHFGIFALYASFFPQLVAGPIERGYRLLPQLRAVRRFAAETVAPCLLLIGWGLFKKLVVADRLALYTDPVLGDPLGYSGLQVAVAPCVFMYRLYCDFSGYSDIAVGVAGLLGVRLMANFNRPFAATTLRGFWQRWHISLTRWMTDFVYVPLARRWRAPAGRAATVVLVFALLGLWHGASWNFVVFGLINGFYLVAGALRPRLPVAPWFPSVLRRVRQRVVCYLLLSSTVLFFATADLHAAFAAIGRIATLRLSGDALGQLLRESPLPPYEWGLAAIGVLVVEAVEYGRAMEIAVGAVPLVLRWALAYGLVFGMLMFGEFTPMPFYYFRF